MFGVLFDCKTGLIRESVSIHIQDQKLFLTFKISYM